MRTSAPVTTGKRDEHDSPPRPRGTMSFATPDPPPPADPSEIDESLVEEVVFDADGAFEAVKSERLHVDRIGVIGLDRTKLHIVARELVRVQAASTLEEVKELVLEAYRDLQSLDIFDAISITIDTSPKVPVYVK